MTLLDIISIFVVIANLALGLFVFIKGLKKKANIFFFLLAIAVAGWVLFNWTSCLTKNYYIALIHGRLTFGFASLIAIFLLDFILYFPHKLNFSKLTLIIVNIFGTGMFIVSSFTPWVVRGVDLTTVYNNIHRGIFYYGFSIYFIVFMVTAFILFFRQYRRANLLTKLKLKYVIYSFAIASIIGTFTNLIWPEILYFLFPSVDTENLQANLAPYGPLFSIIMIGGMTYAIVRYRLMDIKVVIRKGFVHILSFVILLFIYIYLLIYFQKYLTEQYQWPEQTATIVLVLLIVLTIEPLRRFLFRIIDQAFYAKRKEARLEAKKLKLILSSTWQFNDLISKIAKEVQSFFEVKDIQFLLNNQKTGQLETYWPDNAKKVNFAFSDPLFEYIRNKPEILVTEEIPYLLEDTSAAETELLKRIEKKLKELNIGLVWPIGERDELVGIFLLGEKEKKEAFTTDNLDYLAKYHSQAIMTLGNVLLYKQAVERIATMKR